MTEKQVMLAEKLQIDLDDAIFRFMGKEEFLVKMIRKFPSDRSFHNLDRALRDGNCYEAFRAAHTLKGLSSNLGIGIIDNEVSPLTEELRYAPYNYEVIEYYFGRLKNAYADAIEYIQYF